MPTQRKVPHRQCVGCRTMFEKRDLIRVVKSPEGAISLDFKGKAPGRGAYICKNAECLKKARRSKALERTFSLAIPDEVYDCLEREMEENDE